MKNEGLKRERAMSETSTLKPMQEIPTWENPYGWGEGSVAFGRYWFTFDYN